MTQSIFSNEFWTQIELIADAIAEKAATKAINKVSTTKPINDLVDINEASRFSKLKVSTLRINASKRLIPHMKRNGKLYFSIKELEEYIREGKRETLQGIDHLTDTQVIIKKTA